MTLLGFNYIIIIFIVGLLSGLRPRRPGVAGRAPRGLCPRGPTGSRSFHSSTKILKDPIQSDASIEKDPQLLVQRRVLFFNNPKQEQAQIIQKVKGSAGVYIWTNLLNGSRYVGSSINLQKRLYNYYESKDKNTKGQSIIFSALAKYTHSAFTLTVILLPGASKEAVLALEQHVMNTFQPKYNILKIAGSPAGFKLSDEAKTKVSAATLARG